MSREAWGIHHASLGKQRVDSANALISLQSLDRPVKSLPWPDGFASSGGGKEVPKSGTPVVVRVKMRSGELNTLRSAQVRRISWVRRVGRLVCGRSGLLETPWPAGHLRFLR
jgi:hypothetical protein